MWNKSSTHESCISKGGFRCSLHASVVCRLHACRACVRAVLSGFHCDGPVAEWLMASSKMHISIWNRWHVISERHYIADEQWPNVTVKYAFKGFAIFFCIRAVGGASTKLIASSIDFKNNIVWKVLCQPPVLYSLCNACTAGETAWSAELRIETCR